MLSVSSRKTPSFTVSEKTILLLLWLWRERQCDFILMDYDKLEFVEAVEELAASAGLEVPYENAQTNSAINRM